MMWAYALHGVHDLRYEKVPRPEARPGWAVVEVKAAGICSSDIPRIYTTGTYHFPTIPGHEFSGIVRETGSPEDAHWIGKRVSAFPLIPCRLCEPCRRGQYEMCEHYDYIGSRRDGAFAEFVAAPIWNLIETPDNVSFQEAALFEPLSVALHAAKRAGIGAGDSVGVVGTGMIGFAVAQWAKTLGASSVTVIGRSEAKRVLADAMDGVDYRVVRDAQAGPPEYDAVIEAVGFQESVGEAIELTRPGGRLVLMGNPAGDIRLKRDAYWRILRKQLTITGAWNSSYESGRPCDWSEAAAALGSGKIAVRGLISHCFAQDRLPEGLDLMSLRKEPYCKVMTVWNGAEGK